MGTSLAAEADCLLCLVSPTSALEVEVESLPAGGLGHSVPCSEHAVVTVHITFEGGTTGPGCIKRSAIDLPCGGRHVPDYVAILKGQAAMLGNPPQTALDATIPRTEPVSHGDEVCDSPGQLTVVALRNDEGDEDVDLANPNTYTLVRVWSESSETVTMPLCDSSLQLNNSLFCSFVAASRPCVSDTRTAIHLEQKIGMRDRACSAECPGSTDTLNFMAKDTGGADKLTHMTLKVREGDRSEVHFRVRPSTKFHKIFEAYCSRKGLADLAESSIRFIFNGLRLDPNSTPSGCNMEDSDTIDVLMEQVDTPDINTEDTGGADKLTHMTLRVKDEDGSEVHFKVRPSIKFHRIFDAYCSRKGLDKCSVRFYYAARLDLNSTPSKEDMEDGDTIDAFMEQCGGMFVQSSGRDDNEPLAAEPPTATVDVTICIPGDKEVTVSIGAQQTFKEATALAVLQLQLEVAESLAAETNKTMADIKARIKELAGVGSRTMGNSA
mmetsp:Transcript_15633/g.38360  ORF Transcript_15633/g.38360 Transcript_15633/m.38360 type:complete len:494 (-) Transcript_15633:950-2431(-)